METTPPDSPDTERSVEMKLLSKYVLKIAKWYGMIKHYA
jgi:hypothetical protein